MGRAEAHSFQALTVRPTLRRVDAMMTTMRTATMLALVVLAVLGGTLFLIGYRLSGRPRQRENDALNMMIVGGIVVVGAVLLAIVEAVS